MAQRLQELQERIEAVGRDPRTVTIVAVTKGFGSEAVDAALAAGLHDLGENYAQELREKAAALTHPAGTCRWHFLGPVQRNKVVALAPVVHLWHGVDRIEAAVAIAKRSPGASVLVQVNVTGDPRRPGVPEPDVPALVESMATLDLDVAGLMTVASRVGSSDAEPASQFERVAALRNRLGLRELSMGMTDDMEPALVAGSTMIRIGRGLFGARPRPARVRP